MIDNLEDFLKNFDIVNNALDMRTLIRWNGRNLRYKENLAEHTHLVTACVLELYDLFDLRKNQLCSLEHLIKGAMLHDSLEILRGDILSITKDALPEIRKSTDNEENKFIEQVIGILTPLEKLIIKVADLKACYKFLEYELQYPSNDFVIEAYQSCKKKYDEKYEELRKFLGFSSVNSSVIPEHNFVKGYKDDAGTDVILKEDVTFMPMSTTKYDLKVQMIPKENEMGFLCSRTSAAAKGLIVAMCPIDPNFNGTVTAIVHNVSNNIITYRKGESFCQAVFTPILQNLNDKAFIKKEGKRGDGKLGSTGK